MVVVRRVVLAMLAACVIACSPPAGDDPVSTVEPLYQSYLDGQNPPDLANAAPWSNEMRDLLRQMKDASKEQEGPVIDFDPLIDGQDFEITDLTVSVEEPPANGRAVVEAKFKNFGEDVQVHYDLVEDGGWRVDNIRTRSWSLRELLASA
ncbi:MAG: hypothetical protein ABW199_00425, partial [Caulobacterales bacterium]